MKTLRGIARKYRDQWKIQVAIVVLGATIGYLIGEWLS